MSTKPRIHGLYAIADTRYVLPGLLVEAVEQAIAGGAKWIQYRDKIMNAGSQNERRWRQATALKQVCVQHGVRLLINDDVELALQIGADGVHLGRDDCPLGEARTYLGDGAIIGISCYNELARALSAQAQAADYVAFGCFFPSRTKPDAVRASPALLREAKRVLRLPIVAIGGITPENGASLIKAGADALAVIEGVFKQTDIRQAALRYAGLFANHESSALES